MRPKNNTLQFGPGYITISHTTRSLLFGNPRLLCPHTLCKGDETQDRKGGRRYSNKKEEEGGISQVDLTTSFKNEEGNIETH